MSSADPYAFEQAIKAHLKRAGYSQAAVARKLHYSPAQFNKWIRGVNRIPDVVIKEFSDLLDLTDEERTELFSLAGYVAVTDLSKKNDSTGGESVSTGQGESASSLGTVPIGLGNIFIASLKDWNNRFFRWSEAPEHARSSWAGVVLYGMSAVADRITPHGFLTVCLSLLVGIATIQLMALVLLWPLEDAGARWLACIKYGLATLLIPLLVALVTPPDRPGLFQLKAMKQRWTFWILKFTGALVGFWVFSILCISLAMLLYYLHVSPLSAPVRGGVALIPLFFSYVAARRIPIDRYKMFNGELRTHAADRLFLAVFIFMGPLTAFFLHAFYWFFTDRAMAPIVILIALSAAALWHYRQQVRRSTPDSG
jgi:transcriptional regulator with XRE-family HTH domain